MERKRDALLRVASENNWKDSTLQEKLAELESMKPKPYGTFQAASEVYNEAGIRGFWKGIIPTLITVCNPSIQFMIYETSLRSLKEKRATNKLGVKQVTALESKASGKARHRQKYLVEILGMSSDLNNSLGYLVRENTKCRKS
ncbi:peroxisomal nicotinamide adenine dinucleotide carrier-like [Silene latifolia]|uniref:peroxisomal nicotinamide adenine dinucleotide carrier-like n=1 Tax=Silene latifolia TaxID=37657 RepID=UPI003D770EF0